MNIASTSYNLFGGVMLAWAISMLGLTVCLVVWGLAIWHLVTFKDVPNRTLWFVIIICLPIIGAATYYFAAMLPYNRTHPYVGSKSAGK